MEPKLYVHYEDEPAPARSATARIWRDCARQAVIWTTFFVLLAVGGLALQALGYLLPYLPM